MLLDPCYSQLEFLERLVFLISLGRGVSCSPQVQVAHMAPKAAAAAKGVKLDLGHAGKAKADSKDAEFEKF